MNLKHLTDKVLISETKRLVKDERELTTEVLHHLKEIDTRKLYSDFGFLSVKICHESIKAGCGREVGRRM
jgi:hypothetical protein